MAEKDSDKINYRYKGKRYTSKKALDRAKARFKQDKINKKARKNQEKSETKRRVKKIRENLTDEEKKENRATLGVVVKKKLDSYEEDAKKKVKESNKKNVTFKKEKTEPKKFDYKNKSKTQFSASKARRAAKGRTSADIAKDPSFMKNTSKGKYLRGLHFSLRKQGLAGGGVVRKPSTKPSAGNKWN
tara:strand:- start:833 stop:1393 length:561 start_codon:yes stop_codon:yes gene_type:complete